ncbi:MAG: AAA family ATPase [Campylobacteraceae bacterium]|nr:AAA family ATPase [Campylobacteraceae bacterium]
MVETFIHTRNYSKLQEAFARLDDLPITAPKIGLGYGNFGLGKTFALERIAANTHAILLRAVQTWGKKSFLEKLCLELSLDVSGGASRMYERVVDELLQNRRILIIDEIDALLRSQKFEVLELLRDIHDETNIVLFLIGMEEANAKLKKHRHFYSRIIEFVEFKPIIADDVKKFCELSDKVKIEDDLIDYFAKKYPNLRQIRVLLIRLENAAKRNNLTTCDLKTFNSLKIEEEGKV